ncbi:MAG: hypothetical protein ACJ8E1_12330 [Xanthobacteraceae bacterium]
MFFISWGSRVIQRLFGAPEQHHCEICKEDRQFRNMVTYKVFHLWWIFRWVVEKTYGRVCETCGNGPRLAKAQFEVKGAPSPIPVIDRMGWSFGVGGIAALGVMGFVAVSADDKADAAALLHPAVGDVYEVNLAKLEKHPEASEMYSTLLVTRVSGDAVEARLPKAYSTAYRGMSDSVSDGRAKRSDFYEDMTATFTLADLQEMQKNGVILNVDR